MALLEALVSWWAVPAALGVVAASYLYAYLVTNAALRGIPAPPGAQLSSLWLLLGARRGARYRAVDEAHRRLGAVVRIQPNHVSVADDGAIAAIYGHGNGFLKSDFYDAFVSLRTNIFSTRLRVEHTRKRKLVSHSFSASSVAQFELYMRENLRLFVAQMDALVSGSPHRSGAGRPEARLDCLPWFNYLAFDIIGDLAFGAPFGMLRSGADVAELRLSPESPPIHAHAVEVLNRRGEVNATLGCLPCLKPYARLLPDAFFTRGLDAVQEVTGIAITRVKNRLDKPPSDQRKDLLARLMEGRDAKGHEMARDELTSEALAQLIARSDTTSTTSCVVVNYLARNPRVLRKLQAELDAAIPVGTDVPTYDMVRHLTYLGWVIDETLRHHSPSAIGLPRVVPPNSPGVTILGHHFPPGTVLSVPTYTIHRSTDIWGPDADEFRPERWEAATPRQRNAFIPFSHGPRACVGRNVAEMELKLIAATWARRYSVELRQGDLVTREGFLRKPLGLQVALSRRQEGDGI